MDRFKLITKALQLILAMQAVSQAYILCPNQFQKGCVVQLSKLQCKCGYFESCPDPENILETREICEKKLWRARPTECGHWKSWACKAVRVHQPSLRMECFCHNRTACVEQYEYKNLEECETELGSIFRTRFIAPNKCKLGDFYQERVRCGDSRKYCTIYGCQSCCHSTMGCNPNPFLYATTDRCHLGVPSDLFRYPCRAVRCKTGFMCTTNAKLCPSGSPCTELNPTSSPSKLYCVIDPSYNPCTVHECSTGRKCHSSLDQHCQQPPCAASAVCQIDPMYDPCKLQECLPGELCLAEDGKMCENNVCIKEAHCYPDPNAGPPEVRLYSSFSPVIVTGANITLTCEAEANPALISLAFYQNEKLIDQSNNGIELQHFQSGNTSTLALVITNGSANHNGNYTCTASNFLGEDSNFTELSVYDCPSCNTIFLDEQLCSLDTVIMGEAGQVIESTGCWTSYAFNISRIFGRFTTADINGVDFKKDSIIRTKESDCPCQTMVKGRHYLVMFNFKATGQIIDLFPRGRVYLWQTVRSHIQSSTLRCQQVNQQQTDTSVGP